MSGIAGAITFKKAVKYEARGRVALIGPAGSGKSFTMLVMARLLAGESGKIAAIDTEHGSLSKYADLFDFDVIEPDSYTPETFKDSIKAAESLGYAVFCCDSLSHFWMGKDGALEFVDKAAEASKRGGGPKDSFAGWKNFRPHEREMIDLITASKMHVIVTMRTKNEYVEEVNERGKKVRRKIGLAPVQREGLEYEFDLVGLMDDDNSFIVDKTRCPAYAGQVLPKPNVKEFTPFRDWLNGVKRESPTAAPTAPAARFVPDEVAEWFKRLDADSKATKPAFEWMERRLVSKASHVGNDAYKRITGALREKYPKGALMPSQAVKDCLLDLWEVLQTVENPTDVLGDLVTPDTPVDDEQEQRLKDEGVVA